MFTKLPANLPQGLFRIETLHVGPPVILYLLIGVGDPTKTFVPRLFDSVGGAIDGGSNLPAD
jgi:hypothetical protein